MLSFFVASRDQSTRKDDSMYIKVYVSEKEKQQLESIAAKRKVPLSKLCYDQIYPLFSNPLTSTLIFLEKSPMDEKCTESVTVHLTPTEHQTLIQKSGGIALSRYIRNMLFMTLSRLPFEYSLRILPFYP